MTSAECLLTAQRLATARFADATLPRKKACHDNPTGAFCCYSKLPVSCVHHHHQVERASFSQQQFESPITTAHRSINLQEHTPETRLKRELPRQRQTADTRLTDFPAPAAATRARKVSPESWHRKASAHHQKTSFPAQDVNARNPESEAEDTVPDATYGSPSLERPLNSWSPLLDVATARSAMCRSVSARLSRFDGLPRTGTRCASRSRQPILR